jgi:hypothetical protein
MRNVCATNLEKGISTNCGCTRNNEPATNFTGYKELSGKYFSNLRRNASARNLPFVLTIEEAYHKFTGKCALSALPILLVRNEKLGTQTASLDRIDSSLGYTVDNVQWVHKDINLMKNKFPNRYFINICKLIAGNNTD